jgi:RNA recognition motif-containing protein
VVGTTTSTDDGSRRLYVGGIPFGMTETEVGRIFDGVSLPHEVKPVLEVCLVSQANGSPRGIGFVELATSAQAERAKAMLDGRAVSYGGRMPTTLVVRTADPPAPDRARALPLAGRQLWIGNISFSTRASPLRDAFAIAAGVQAGGTSDVWCNLVRDSSSRRPTGCATVRFPDVTSARRALEAMNGAEHDGRRLHVQWDTRTGPAPEDSGKDVGARTVPAADAIDPDVLAAVESSMMQREMNTRQRFDIERQAAIHRHYLRSLEAEKRRQRKEGGAARARVNQRLQRQRRRRRRGGLDLSSSSGTRVTVSNLSFAVRAAVQQRAIMDVLSACPELMEDPYRKTQPNVGPPVVRVGPDRFGRSRGVATVFTRTLSQAEVVTHALNGTVLDGRTLRARRETAPELELNGLPLWQPLWLARASSLAGKEPPPPNPNPLSDAAEESVGDAQGQVSQGADDGPAAINVMDSSPESYGRSW